MAFRLSELLKIRLKEQGIGVPTLAKKTGISRKTLANWIEGQKPQNIEQVKIVADFFEVTVDELCFGPQITVAKQTNQLEKYSDEINAGVFEVVLRRVKR